VHSGKMEKQNWEIKRTIEKRCRIRKEISDQAPKNAVGGRQKRRKMNEKRHTVKGKSGAGTTQWRKRGVCRVGGGEICQRSSQDTSSRSKRTDTAVTLGKHWKTGGEER